MTIARANDTTGIATCARSLTTPGTCCANQCPTPATVAIAVSDPDQGVVEHARCTTHANLPGERTLATKPLILDPTWAPMAETARTVLTAHDIDNAILDKSDGRYQMTCQIPDCGHTNPATWDTHAVIAALTTILGGAR